MAKKTDAIVVLVTCKSKAEARRIVSALIEKRLAACGNILDWRVSSIFRWHDKVESTKEHLVILKSTRQGFRALEREVKRLHSYDVPEIIALPITIGSRKYLAWVAGNVGTK